ncbi:MAG: exodeoxyribonuclease III [Alphaproteobacteria bacterium]|nr:exodeoxyribonuclease III [Alphaproteobacteria bacterium]
MRLVTWNINSVRLRLPIIKKLTEEVGPDILCLQETKTPDEHFPVDALKAMGYEHQHFHGMKSYNGVCILSKHPFEGYDIHHRVGREDCRHVAASVNGFELHNLYIPAGGDEPDPEANDKFAYKLDFVDEMTRWFKDRYTSDQKLIAVGDFNIAPYEHDVWSHKQLLKVVSHTPPEIERLAKMKDSLEWTDVARHFVPMDEKVYTWWSYRNRDWKKSNRGRRLDHVWVTPPLKDGLQSHNILSEARDWEKPSDHVPVIVELKAA